MGARVNGQAPGLPTLKRPATKDHLDKKERPWRIIEVCTSQAAVHALEEAEDAFDRASFVADRSEDSEAASEALEAARRDLDEAKGAVAEATREVLMVSVGQERYNAVLKAHTTTVEATPEAPEPSSTIDNEAVNRAIIAASCHVPADLDVEDVARYERVWNPVEYQKLLAAAVEVNTTSRLVELGRGSSRPLMAVRGR